MTAGLAPRWARRRAVRLLESDRRARVAAVVRETRVVWRLNLQDGAGRTVEARGDAYGPRRFFRGRFRGSLATLDVRRLAALPLPAPNVALEGPSAARHPSLASGFRAALGLGPPGGAPEALLEAGSALAAGASDA